MNWNDDDVALKLQIETAKTWWNATVNCKQAQCIHVYMNEGIGVFEFVIVAKFCDRRTSIFNMNF